MPASAATPKEGIDVIKKSFGEMILLSLVIFSSPWAIVAQEAVSEVPEIMVAAVTKLPQGPGPVRKDDNCSTSLVEPETAAGRIVQQRGWGVLSEFEIEDYSLVSFAGEFIPGTSGSCAIRQGNIGVFEGSRLTAIMYTASKSDELIGRLIPLENGDVRLWSSGYLEYPVADILVGSIGLVIRAVASEDAFCHGKVTVPNIFGIDITVAREELQAAGWEPEKQPRLEWGQQPDLQDLGVIEAVDCSGTGFGFCAYEYRRQGASLRVTTAGELWGDSVPGVTDYSVTCDS